MNTVKVSDFYAKYKHDRTLDLINKAKEYVRGKEKEGTKFEEV